MTSLIVDLKDHPDIQRVIRAASSGYRKHKAILVATTGIEMNDMYWSGGSRSSYSAVNLKTLAVGSAGQQNPPQFGGKTPQVAIPEGAVIVKLGTFCGRPATATVFINPANMPPVLETTP